MPEEMMSIPAPKRESRDVSGGFILGAFLLLVSGLGMVALLCWWIFPRAPFPGLVPYPVPQYPPPQLQAAPHEDMVRFYRHELDRLNSLGWVDRNKGIAHIPIAEAMQQVAREGIADWPQGSPQNGGGK